MDCSKKRSKQQLLLAVVASTFALHLSGCNDVNDFDRNTGASSPPVAAIDQNDTASVGSNASLKEKVGAAISAEPALDSVVIDVSPSGEVTLSGTANSHANRIRAAQIVLNVEGVAHVQNDLIVKEAT